MQDYQPLDISRWCNADLSLVASDPEPSAGLQSFRGLPFLVGAEGASPGDSSVVELQPSDRVTIPVGSTAHNVIFAHRLIESKEFGAQVGAYVFRMADGVEHIVGLREGFELTRPGRIPTRAVEDMPVRKFDRHQGQWRESGRRAMEAGVFFSGWYYLWAWRNPSPDVAIDSIEISSSGLPFVVAGVTLGHVDEHPFTREGRRPATVTLTDPETASQLFDLEVEVDRGDATYIFPLPAIANEEFLADEGFKGWGQEQNTASSPAYVEISAIPSATLTVKRSDEAVAAVNWGQVEKNGVAEDRGVRVELSDPGKNWVHVTVLDDDTGKPIPCRVHFRTPNGIPYQPYGHHNQANSNLPSTNVDIGGDVRIGQITYAYTDGTCQGWLPRGKVVLDVARGFEYEPLRTTVSIAPGQRKLTLRLKRWTHMADQGWYSGDSHVHFLSTNGAHFESLGEDLNVANLLQSQWGTLFTNVEDFTGDASVSQAGDSIVYVSQENRQHFFGHLILWGLKKPVMPVCTNGLGEAELGGTLEMTMSEWADQAHGQGGTVIVPHFSGLSGENIALITSGRVEGIEFVRMHEDQHEQYYKTLNCGYRLPLIGGTDKMSSDVPIGLYRTYAKLLDGDEFDYESWCRAVKAGRTFLSGGPMIGITVEGHEVGDTLDLSGPGIIEVHAWAESIFPINRLEVVQEGRVVASADSKEPTRRLELKEKIKVEGHTWLAARCGGPSYFTEGNFNSAQVSWERPEAATASILNTHFDSWRRGIFAHTSPVYVACNGEWTMFNEDTARHMLTALEGDLAFIREVSPQYSHGNVTHHHGEDDHRAYLERPFHEARSAIEDRLRSAGINP